jgi:hypothetical protein
MLRAGPTCLSIAGRAGWRLAGTGLRSASSLFSARASAAGQHERVSQTPYPYPPTAHARRSPDGGWGFAAAALVVAGAGVRTSSATDHDDVPLREVALVSEQWCPGLEGLIVSGELKRLRQARPDLPNDDPGACVCAFCGTQVGQPHLSRPEPGWGRCRCRYTAAVSYAPNALASVAK